MTTNTIKIGVYRINPNDPRTVTGSRQRAHRVFKRYGVAVWLRACGTRAVVFYRDPVTGRRRQSTSNFGRLELTEPVRPYNAAHVETEAE